MVEGTTEGHIEGAGGKMVFVKVRETYDLHTVQNKMTVIAIHTPKPGILKRNYPGLLMQCKAYRPVSADVRIACASMLPLDPLGVGVAEGDIAPEDVFNPILYKAMSNFGMSQLEARINAMTLGTVSASGNDVEGDTALVDVNSVTPATDEFPIYYGLLSNTHDWKHANPQQGLVMNDLKPLVWEMVYNVGDNINYGGPNGGFSAPAGDSNNKVTVAVSGIRGNAKPMPFINCTSYNVDTTNTAQAPGFVTSWDGADRGVPVNAETNVPWIKTVCGVVIIPPSRRHSLFFRMVVEWTIEFSQIRPIGDITNWDNLGHLGDVTHYQNYSYESTKKAVTGSEDTILDNDSCMVSSNVEVNQVM